MKRAIITDEVSQDLARAVSIAKNFDLDGIELRSAWDKDAHELSDDDIRCISDIVIEEGLEVACIASPSFKCSLSSETEYRAHLRILERSSVVARKLNCSLVRGFTFWDEGVFQENLLRAVTLSYRLIFCHLNQKKFSRICTGSMVSRT